MNFGVIRVSQIRQICDTRTNAKVSVFILNFLIDSRVNASNFKLIFDQGF